MEKEPADSTFAAAMAVIKGAQKSQLVGLADVFTPVSAALENSANELRSRAQKYEAGDGTITMVGTELGQFAAQLDAFNNSITHMHSRMNQLCTEYGLTDQPAVIDQV